MIHKHIIHTHIKSNQNSIEKSTKQPNHTIKITYIIFKAIQNVSRETFLYEYFTTITCIN